MLAQGFPSFDSKTPGKKQLPACPQAQHGLAQVDYLAPLVPHIGQYVSKFHASFHRQLAGGGHVDWVQSGETAVTACL